MTFNTTDFKFHNTGIAISDALFDRIMASFQHTSTHGASRDSILTLLSHSEGSAELGRFSHNEINRCRCFQNSNTTLYRANVALYERRFHKDV